MKKQTHRIGLDIDGVLADFTRAWSNEYPDTPAIPNKYNYDPLMGQRFKDMEAAGTLDKFFLGIEPLIDPKELQFNPIGYVTARPVDSSTTIMWLHKHGFPINCPVITVQWGTNKVEAMKRLGVEIFIDDFYENFKELNDAGILCYLYSAPWNMEYDVDGLRLNSLNDILLLQE